MTITAEQPPQSSTTRSTYLAGSLHLDFRYAAQRRQTEMHVLKQQPPLKVIRAFPLQDEGAMVHLHNVSGGILGGDQLSMHINVGPRAYAQVTTTSATRIYRSNKSTPPATQTCTVRVEENALLEYLPDQLIPFAASSYHQQTRVELCEGAGLFWWETIAPGRASSNEYFAYRSLHLDFALFALGRPIAIERMHIEPEQHTPAALARLGPYHYFSSFYICKAGLPASSWSQLEHELNTLARDMTIPGEQLWGVSTLTRHGLVVRSLSRQGREIVGGHLAFWRAARTALYGRAIQPPRKLL